MRSPAFNQRTPRGIFWTGVLWICLPIAAVAALAPAQSLGTGELNGARYTIARPADWNGRLLLLAHGYRPETAPLSASVSPADPAYAPLLADGWVVAATSYRRNGLIIRDAIADLEALRDLIAHTDGPPKLVLLLGESMGGTIVTLMAELPSPRYQGAIAIGAALDLREPDDPIVPTGLPVIPLLFLTNQSELTGPAAYVAAAGTKAVSPALWTVARDGHVNVNAAERAAAIDAVLTWIKTGEIDRHRTATVDVGVPADHDVEIIDGAARGRVVSVTSGYGNLFTNFTVADFATLGIRRGDRFVLEAGGKSWSVIYGRDFGDAPAGEWVAFLRAEGAFLIAINRGSAATTARVGAGDPLLLRPAPQTSLP